MVYAQYFDILEEQLLSFHFLKHSPDRVDALVWGIYALQHHKFNNSTSIWTI